MGRGRAAVPAALVLCLVLLLHNQVAEAAVYKVGGAGGWNFNTIRWPDAKHFKAGDVLGEYQVILLLQFIIFYFSYKVFWGLLCSKARQPALGVSV